ncbi:DUF6011 domain-containing protein [Micromonospora tulbaghiae]|uniref:DUF6011 domain-containing protein n=1 Tax=Micromonospora tulbaghiae TaxID=479978 RepID=UPI0033BCCB16
MAEPEQPLVLCLDCNRKCKTPVSRARRIGAKCWRKRRALARAQAAPVALPGLAGRGGRAGQPGPDLLDATDSACDVCHGDPTQCGHLQDDDQWPSDQAGDR